MVDPIFWLGLSILLVAVSLTAVLVVALPAFRELARAARSAEKLFDTLSRELPPTLEAIRLTGLEISDLTDEVSVGVQSAGQVAKQVDQSIRGVKKQAQQAQVGTRSVFAGVKAAWKTLRRSPSRRPSPTKDHRLPPSTREPINFDDRYPPRSTAQPHDYQEEYREEYQQEWEDGVPIESPQYRDGFSEPRSSAADRHPSNASASPSPDQAIDSKDFREPTPPPGSSPQRWEE